VVDTTALPIRLALTAGAAHDNRLAGGRGTVHQRCDARAASEGRSSRNIARNLNDGEGFGLGLSIARDLVERNGGSLKFCDRSPKGLNARIEMPSVK